MVKIKNVPKNIYLQTGLDKDNSDVEFKEISGISWCAERINNTDLKFQLNQTQNRLFTKEEMISFALYVPDFKSAIDKRKYLEDNFDVWALIRK